MRGWIRIIAWFAGVGLGVAGVLWAFAAAFRPDLTAPLPTYAPEVVKAAREARDVSFDPDDPVVLHVDVDYSQGTNAPWYPRHEAPVLHKLVEEGKLPPVAERVGPEPCVMRGVDGIGRYGGTWIRVATTPNDVNVITYRMSGCSFLRWSPYGYPLKPHLAKSLESRKGNREFIMTLRRGLRWSDGEPFDADDIMYWWQDEILDRAAGSGRVPDMMMIAGKAGSIEKLDAYHLKFAFPEPYGLFPEMLARSSYGMYSPRHYLLPYHPRRGDPALIERAMQSTKLSSRRSLYTYLKDYTNPEHPRMWPWIYRTYKSTPPQVYVRNPYYFVVDEDGNQLPYVDRVQFEVQDGKQIPISAANGFMTMQTRHLRFEYYTELMSRTEQAGTRVLLWYPSTRSVYVINPNQNRRIDPDEPATRWKSLLLSDREFRQALSLAIDRQTIIDAEYNGLGVPSQVAPGPESPFRHDGMANAFIAYDPKRAKTMLDAIWTRLGGDPAQRDSEGYRVYPDGKRMVFYLDFCAFTGIGPAQFIVDDWGEVGIRIVPRQRDRALFYQEKAANNFDFNVWTGESEYLPLIEPRHFIASSSESFYAGGWGLWYQLGGFYDSPQSRGTGQAIPVPKDHPMYRAMTWFDRTIKSTTREEQKRNFNHVMDIAATNLWTISIATAPPQPVVVAKGFRNVPRNALYAYVFSTPANAGIETYYFEHPVDSPGAIRETQQAILQVTPLPDLPRDEAPPATATATATATAAVPAEAAGHGRALTTLLRRLLGGILLAALLLVAFRHPFIARRIALMAPTLFIVSLLVFTIIQLPPGDFLTTLIMQLREAGDNADAEKDRLEELEKMFHFSEPGWKRYMRWMGVYWFLPAMGRQKADIQAAWRQAADAADAADEPVPPPPGLGFFRKDNEGLLQGNMGRSMETSRSVNAIVGDRILLTVLISLGTIVLTWALAIPIGIYSAVKQYSLGDYVFTFVGFIGMCVPSFLLALILMALANIKGGLFSPEFAAQPEWTTAKVLDLLRHVWIPIVVLGVTGTAGMIRVMRANLLDELKKPYVTTARAKGVRPMRLLLKYPVRLALNPFISGIGALFPQLVSGGAIVAVVLSLPTVGPLMLNALFSQDMYLAGSMLMVLSLLGILGTLVSDLLLLALDPRIRLDGGGR